MLLFAECNSRILKYFRLLSCTCNMDSHISWTYWHNPLTIVSLTRHGRDRKESSTNAVISSESVPDGDNDTQIKYTNSAARFFVQHYITTHHTHARTYIRTVIHNNQTHQSNIWILSLSHIDGNCKNRMDLLLQLPSFFMWNNRTEIYYRCKETTANSIQTINSKQTTAKGRHLATSSK